MKEIVLPKIVTIGIYNSDIAARNKTITKNRTTTMFEIEIPIEKGGISYINSEETPITTDIVICAKPGQIRHTRLPYKCYYIHLIATDGELYDSLMKIPDFFKTNKYNEYSSIFKELIKFSDTAVDSDDLMVQSLTLKLIYLLIKETNRSKLYNPIKKGNYDVTMKVINYIKENISSDLTLEKVAKYAGFSPIHFHNYFKSSTGRTLHEYVEEQRIKKAVNLLITTDYTLSEIAYECGFSSQSYFSFAFKRKMNKTPREYTKWINKRYEE